jgi:hypothetical protein
LSIERGLKLQTPISYYLLHTAALAKDSLSPTEWNELRVISKALEPFWEVTMRLESHAKAGAKGVIWEALPSFDFLLSKCENQVSDLTSELTTPGHPEYVKPLLLCYQNAWEKLRKYNDLTDTHHELYAASTFLNPCLKKGYFIERWTGTAAVYIEEMLKKNRKSGRRNISRIHQIRLR